MLSWLLWFSTTKSTMGSLSGVSVTKMHNGRILFAPKFGNFVAHLIYGRKPMSARNFHGT